MQPKIRIRTGMREDIPAIKQIAESTWPVAYRDILSKPQLRYMLELFYNPAALAQAMASGQNFLLAYPDQDTRPCGFAAAGSEGSAIWKLHKLYVIPAAQGTGAGKALLQAIERMAEANGAKSLILNVNRFNPSAQFYQRNGYEKTEAVDVAIGNGYFMNDFIMRKSLAERAE